MVKYQKKKLLMWNFLIEVKTLFPCSSSEVHLLLEDVPQYPAHCLHLLTVFKFKAKNGFATFSLYTFSA